MKKIIIPILVALLTLFVVGCQSHIVGDSVTGGVVAPISYGEIMEEPLGDQMVSVREFTINPGVPLTPCAAPVFMSV